MFDYSNMLMHSITIQYVTIHFFKMQMFDYSATKIDFNFSF